MSKDYIPLGPTPPDEDSTQVGDSCYLEKSNFETEIWISQLERTFQKQLDTGIKIIKMTFDHDLGEYREAAIIFNNNDKSQVEAAFYIDNNLPTKWDDIAKEKIKILKKNPQTSEGDVAVLQQALLYLKERPETARQLPTGVLRFFERRGFWRNGITQKGKEFIKIKYNPRNKTKLSPNDIDKVLLMYLDYLEYYPHMYDNIPEKAWNKLAEKGYVSKKLKEITNKGRKFLYSHKEGDLS